MEAIFERKWLDNESKVVLLCARSGLSPAEVELLNVLISGEPDWSRIFVLGHQLNILVRLWKNIRRYSAHELPAELTSTLEQEIHHRNRRKALLDLQCIRLHNLAGNEGIALLPFKGPALAALCYSDPSERAVGDLDFLVDEGQVVEVQSLLLRNGFSPRPVRDPPLTEEFFQSDLFRMFTDEHTFGKADNMLVDLHWRILPQYLTRRLVRIDSVDCVQVKVGGNLLPTPGPEMHLSMLAVHGTKHQWLRLHWVIDIAELVSNSQLDWDKAMHHAKDYHVQGMIDLALYISRRFINPQMLFPDVVENRIAKNERLPVLAERSFKEWFQYDPRRENIRNYMRYYLLSMDSVADRTRCISRWLAQPTVPDYLACPLPARLYPLYLLIHPLLIVINYLKSRISGANSVDAEQHNHI